jgi:hypothetical protein
MSTVDYTKIQYPHENAHEYATGFWYIYECGYEISVQIQYAHEHHRIYQNPYPH